MQKQAKCVLITGVTGFVGSHLAERFIQLGIEVHAIVRASSNIGKLPSHLKGKIVFHIYDQQHNIMDIFEQSGIKPQIVYHVAAMVLTVHQHEDIQNLINSNIAFGVELLDAMKKYHIYNFVNTGTFWQHYNNDDYNPVDLYAASKQAFEVMMKYYEQTGNLKVINLHLSDNYGPNDLRGKIFNLLKDIAKSGKVLAMSPGEQLMDIVYIDDIVDAYVLAGEYLLQKKYNICGTYAVSSNGAISLRRVVEIYEEVIGTKLHIQWGGRLYRDREVMVPWNCGKLLPGWAPKTNLYEGLKQSIF